MGITDTIFNPLLGWVFHVHPLLAIVIISLVLALISTLLQKYMTDQAKMRRHKDDLKKYQDQMKKSRDDPSKMMEMQGKMMPLQMEMMKEQFKPLLISIIPFLLIIFWLNTHFAFYPIAPNAPFVVSGTFVDNIGGNVTLVAPGLSIDKPEKSLQTTVQKGMFFDSTINAANWTVSGPAGEYDLNMTFAGNTVGTRKVLITNDRLYDTPQQPMQGLMKSFDVSNAKLTPLGGFHIFSWYPGWIFYYFVFSIVFSLGLKKVLNVV